MVCRRNRVAVWPRSALNPVATGKSALPTPPTPDPAFEQWVEPLIGRLVPILLSGRSPKSLTENAAVTIGRISLVCPGPVAPHLEVFAQQW